MKFKRFKRLSVTLAFAVALSIPSFAQQPSANAPSVDRLRNTIMYLASDALEGRRTGTQGANDAAHYIAAEFNMLGLRPGMAGGGRTRGENRARYLQPFPYVSKVELGKNNLFFVNSGRADDIAQFKVGEDWMPLGFSSNGELKTSAAIFVGYGITDAALQYNDYPSATTGKIALAISGTPDADNPHGQFVQAGQIRFKAAAARAAGARALLLMATEDILQHDRL